MRFRELLPFYKPPEFKAAVARDRVRSAVTSVWERLHKLHRERGGSLRVLFTGCEARAGVTLVSLSVAESLATHLRQEVQLIEANVARPGLANYLGLSPEPGLGELLSGAGTEKISPTDLVQKVPGHFSFRIISGGGQPRERVPGELASPVARKFWDHVEPAPYTLIDGGVLLESPDSRLLLNEVDVVVLVVRARSTSRSEIEDAVRTIADYGKPLVGTVLNRYRSDMPLGLE